MKKELMNEVIKKVMGIIRRPNKLTIIDNYLTYQPWIEGMTASRDSRVILLNKGKNRYRLYMRGVDDKNPIINAVAFTGKSMKIGRKFKYVIDFQSQMGPEVLTNIISGATAVGIGITWNNVRFLRITKGGEDYRVGGLRILEYNSTVATIKEGTGCDLGIAFCKGVTKINFPMGVIMG